MSAPRRYRIERAEAFGRVAVLLGGASAEREVSLASGRAVLAALRARGIDAHPVDPRDDGLEGLRHGGFARVWNALHGRGGEDGTMQGWLAAEGIACTGSGVLGSAIAMDKLRTKRLLAGAGLSTAPFLVVDAGMPAETVIERLGLPLFVKPAREGSSVGMSRVDRIEALPEAIAAARVHDETVLAESFLSGGEYTVAVLQGEPLPAIRIKTPRTFYDYEAKYHAGTTSYHCPCGLDSTAEDALVALALAAFDIVGARGWGRVDLMFDDQRCPQVLEVNTVPGMTDHSLVPMAAAAAGLEFAELVWRVLETSFDGAMCCPGGRDAQES